MASVTILKVNLVYFQYKVWLKIIAAIHNSVIVG